MSTKATHSPVDMDVRGVFSLLLRMATILCVCACAYLDRARDTYIASLPFLQEAQGGLPGSSLPFDPDNNTAG